MQRLDSTWGWFGLYNFTRVEWQSIMTFDENDLLVPSHYDPVVRTLIFQRNAHAFRPIAMLRKPNETALDLARQNEL